MTEEFKNILLKHLPENAVDLISELIIRHKITLKINKKRITKFGDYRSPANNSGHIITINRNLNKYSFLITLVHEISHLVCWNENKKRTKPHGKNWKENFKKLMFPFLNERIFPEEILLILTKYLDNPAASTLSDTKLMRILMNYDTETTDNLKFTLIENIPDNLFFEMPNGRKFRKIKKIRKRYKCVEVNTNKIYLFNPLANVIVVDN
ncbi:MAG: SprT-like domain-containing protein [Bacteroidales bacterium]|nr:SprT-like domain-containing protein [Bacteroidales bacterium]